jgi:hypothetical protein
MWRGAVALAATSRLQIKNMAGKASLLRSNESTIMLGKQHA